MTNARRRCRGTTGVVTAALVAVLLGGTAVIGAPAAAAVPPPPPNPSDQQIAASEAAAALSATEVGRLSAQLSSTQDKIRQLNDAMELKAEIAMQAQQDLQDAKWRALAAQDAVYETQLLAEQADEAIEEARQRAARFAAASYRQGSAVGSITTLIDADSMDQLLSRQYMIQQVSASQSAVLSNLRTAHTSKANRDSDAKAALAAAEDARQEAQEAQEVADAAEAAATAAFEDGQAELADLESQLAHQQAAYQQALDDVAALRGQRQQYTVWLQAKQEEDRRLAQQRAAQVDFIQQQQKEQELEQQRRRQLEMERALAIQEEKQHQEELRKERERLAALGEDPDTADEATVPASQRAATVIAAAKKWIGTPYAWGGGNSKGPTRGIRDGGIADRYGDYKKIGFDCSGLVLHAYAQVGIYLPHYSGYQYRYGQKISKANLQPGDLVFYAYNTSNPATIHHVAIYLGGNQMIEAPQSGSHVKISPMRWRGYIGATRPGT